MLFADLLSLHLVTFLFFLFLFTSLFFSSRCILELKCAIYYRAASLPSQASYALLCKTMLNYAMKLILRKPHRTSSEPLRRLLQLQTLSHGRANNVFSQVYRCLSNKAPAYLPGKFVRNNTPSRYNATRGAVKLHLRRPKTEFYRRSFEYMGVKLYNELPENRL